MNVASPVFCGSNDDIAEVLFLRGKLQNCKKDFLANELMYLGGDNMAFYCFSDNQICTSKLQLGSLLTFKKLSENRKSY